MRLMLWNIYNGFSNWNEQIVASAKEIINDYEPDILVLNEALNCELFDGKIYPYHELGDYKYFYGKLYAKNWGNAILSKFPITEKINLNWRERNALVVDIEGIRIATYHPHPHHNFDDKKKHFQEIVNLNPDVICGDFNMIDPEISKTYRKEEKVKGFEKFASKPEKEYMRFVEEGEHMFPFFKNNNFSVANLENEHTIPTDFCSLDKTACIKIDYVMVNNHIKVEQSSISKIAEHISDHRPVIVDFIKEYKHDFKI